MNARALVGVAALLVAALLLGWFGRDLLGPAADPHAGHVMPAAAGESPCPGGAEPLYWKAPMDPTFIRPEPGKSPMGMDLVPECPAPGGGAAEGTVRVDATTVQNMGMRTAPAGERVLRRSLRAVGRVATDERRVAHVHTKVQGWVESLAVDYVGQSVERGQPLLEIYSPELVATQEELLTAQRYREATRKSPFDDVRGGGERLLEAAQRRLALWDVPTRDVERVLRTGRIQKTLTLYAPSRGVVTELGVRAGMEVEPNQNLYTIADLSAVWVLAEVYETELPWIAVGDTGEVELASFPGERFRGPITYVAPFLDPTTRTAELRLELPNPDRRLKPEMFGNVLLQGAPHRAAVAVPSEAVIRSGRRNVVVVALGEGRFEPREVKLGLEGDGGHVEVLAGVEAGETVVSSGQFLLDSESRLQEAVRKLLAAQPGGTVDHSGHDVSQDGMDHSGQDVSHEGMEH